MLRFLDEPAPFNDYLDRIELIDGSAFELDLATPEYADLPGREYETRYARLAALMDTTAMDAILVSQEENVRYTTGYLSGLWGSKFRPYLAILPRDLGQPAGLILPKQERLNAELTSWIPNLTIYPSQEPPAQYIVQALAGRGLLQGRVGIELGFGQRIGMNQQQLHELMKLAPDVEFVDATPLLQTVRMLKSEAELERLAMASWLSEEGTRRGWEVLRPGMTERELVAVMVSRMYELGAEVGTKASHLLIMAGDRFAMSNGIASHYEIREGDLVLVDGGATYRGYVCDFMRQAIIGRPTQDQSKWLAATLAANDAAIDKVAPGVAGYEVYDAAIESFAEHGLADYNRANIIGHGSGMDIHEVPWIGERSVYTSDVRLRAGMVLSIEPGLVQPEAGPAGHFTIEDVVAVTDTGCSVLTNHLAKSLHVVEIDSPPSA